MINQLKQHTEWVTLNIVNTVFLIKEWVLVQVGVHVAAGGIMDEVIKWAIGITIVVFNVVRIVKYILDIKYKRYDK